MLPTKAFLAPMDEDEEIEVELAKGNTVVIKYKALSELQPNGKRYMSLSRALLVALSSLTKPRFAPCLPGFAFIQLPFLIMQASACCVAAATPTSCTLLLHSLLIDTHQ